MHACLCFSDALCHCQLISWERALSQEEIDAAHADLWARFGATLVCSPEDDP